MRRRPACGAEQSDLAEIARASLAGGKARCAVGAYARAVFMFDGHDADQLEAAQVQWKAMKAAGHAVTYWQQTPERRRERKA